VLRKNGEVPVTTEPEFIGALRSLATHPGARGLEDDAAVLEIGGETLVITHDAMAEGIHFRAGQDPADVAWKLVATNLSDLAAKGAEPLGVLLGYQLGDNDARFVEGLDEVLTHYGVPLLGGDTIGGTGAQVLGLTALGRATHNPVPSRSGACPGDRIYMTGVLGEAMHAFDAGPDASPSVTLAYRRPEPRLKEGQALAPLVTAMMDISDGLLLDAWRMAQASGVTFALDHLQFPFRAGAIMADWQRAIRWGEDYELLFTAPATAQLPGHPTWIGTVEPAGDTPLTLDGRSLNETNGLGYQH
jgi:thiamine-monophosphate kinase